MAESQRKTGLNIIEVHVVVAYVVTSCTSLECGYQSCRGTLVSSSSGLTMEEVCSSEAVVSTNQAKTRHYNSGGLNMNLHPLEGPRS
jgi:hypothetical protein